MKRLIVLSAVLLSVFCAFGQNADKHLDAEELSEIMLGKTYSELIGLMKDEKCLYMDSSYAVYSVYYKRRGEHIKLRANFGAFLSDTIKVWNVEFIYNTKNTYGTNDLQEAFWIEYIKNLK